ncbi:MULTISPECIES: hypothetical protein [unclassified Streptomyces]|nr:MULTISPECIES: hypothetical protein [unclassified Streptomyces]
MTLKMDPARLEDSGRSQEIVAQCRMFAPDVVTHAFTVKSQLSGKGPP